MANYEFKTRGLIGAAFPWSFRWRGASAASESTLSTAFTSATTALFTTATNGLENFMSADVTVTGTTVATLTPTMHWSTATDAALAITGTDANPSLPWNIAEVIGLTTVARRKAFHGRIFLPPFAEDQIAAHVILAATTAKMKIVFDAYWSSINVAGVIPFVTNMKPLKDGTAAFTTMSMTGYNISNKPAQQRRRVSKLVPLRVFSAIP